MKPDHQRGGSCSGPTGVSACVLAREPVRGGIGADLRQVAGPASAAHCLDHLDHEPQDKRGLSQCDRYDTEIEQHLAECRTERPCRCEQNARTDQEHEQDAAHETDNAPSHTKPRHEQGLPHEPSADPDRIDEERADKHDPLRYRPQAAGELRHESRRDHCNADEQQEAADGEREQAHHGRYPVSEKPVCEERDGQDDDDQRDERRVLREPARRESRPLADRGDRRHLRRPHRREDPGDERDEDPDPERDQDGLGAEVQGRRGQVVVGGLEERVDTPGEQEAADEPEDRREHADDERFQRHGCEQLPT